MANKLFMTRKFKSSQLKYHKYNMSWDFTTGFKNGEVVKLADSEMLRVIRQVVYKNNPNDLKRVYSKEQIEVCYEQINKIRQSKDIDVMSKQEQIKRLQDKIQSMLFIPEYVTVVIEHNSHYDKIIENGFTINGVHYKRISTSASQGRVSTVSFCDSSILDEVNEILDNGRNKSVLLSPAKYNAYKGLYSSATKVVTKPRICVVEDYSSETTFDVDFVVETKDNEDDIIEQRTITKSFDRFDGQGLISPTFAKVWSNDLNLDYVPAEFCFRWSFMKGMLCVFDFHDFCKLENNNNFLIKTAYKDKNGEPIYQDLREIDVIVTTSQFKLWKSYSSFSEYENYCDKHNLQIGVSLYTPKHLKDMLYYNYQFLQVLNLSDDDIDTLTTEFKNWINGVTMDNPYYTLLFLMGLNINQDSIQNLLESDNYITQAVLYNHNMLNDVYIRRELRKMLHKKIDDGCMGRIILSGNNQTLVSDPYAFMQFVCGQEVTGLLKAKEYYSAYWNNRNVDKVVGTRPPLTYRSEVTKLSLVADDKMRYWYKYLYGGIIVNVQGYETDLWAGSDDPNSPLIL